MSGTSRASDRGPIAERDSRVAKGGLLGWGHDLKKRYGSVNALYERLGIPILVVVVAALLTMVIVSFVATHIH